MGGVLVTLGVQFAITGGLFQWGRWVARRRGTRGWARAAWLPVVAGVMWALGLGGTLLGLARAFSHVATLPAEAKVAALASGIEAAMWSTALLAIPSGLVYLASVVVFAVGSLRPGGTTARSSRP